ncbi:hypothetical protein BaRGS_00019351 [Batillaria attramentaria]|uniref:Uncharacterized protein n=1 Tax=Batillaria attramentaria TaxID=370345 RepID=A0ABD0KQ93_9CAEN
MVQVPISLSTSTPPNSDTILEPRSGKQASAGLGCICADVKQFQTPSFCPGTSSFSPTEHECLRKEIKTPCPAVAVSPVEAWKVGPRHQMAGGNSCRDYKHGVCPLIDPRGSALNGSRTAPLSWGGN